MRISLRRPSPALVVSGIALFVALAGTSYATVLNVPRNSVGTAQLKRSAVTSPKIASGAVTSAKVRNRTLVRADFAPGALVPGPPGPAGAAGPPGLSGLERVEITSVNSSATSRSGAIACPSGKRLVGGGARVGPIHPNVTVALQSSYPDNDNTFRAFAREMSATNANWTLTVFAVCANAT